MKDDFLTNMQLVSKPMSEIEKMYENCEIYPDCRARECGLDYCANSSGCGYAVYPDFAAEKQIELIKFLMEQEDFSWTIAQQGKDTEYAFYVGYEHGSGCFKEFTEALAGIINDLWQDLTSEEKQQIKEILE